MGPELLAAAGVDHQLDVWADCLAGCADEQFIIFAVTPAKRPPAQLDRLETTCHRLLKLFAQRTGLVEEHRAIGLDPVAIVAAEEPRHRLIAHLAEEVP